MTIDKRTKAQILEENWRQDMTIQLLEERFADLELAIEDRGWLRLSTESQREFSREGLRKIMLLAVMSFIKNPLIRHATQVQASYVWGQGVNIHCPDEGRNKIIQTFLKDRHNKKVLTGHQARIEKEEELSTKGNLFIVLFTNRTSGRVQVRSFPAEECQDIIRNPDDSAEVWYYKRMYNRVTFDTTRGAITETKNVTEYYPDWLYEPDSKPANIGGNKVNWEAPVYHIGVGRLGDMKFGIPEMYSALDWAVAVKNDLEDYATIRRALARFAFKLTAPTGPKAVSKAKQKLGTTLGTNAGTSVDSNPPPVAGSTWIQPQGGANLEPLKTAGMAPNPEEGRRLWLMVSAGSGIPETILTGDSSVGNYATSRTLDRPTELKMTTRQELWADTYRDILTYVVRKSQGSISGELTSVPAVVEAAVREAQRIVLTEATGVVDLSTPTGADADTELEAEELQIHVDFPKILEQNVAERIRAIVSAATLDGKMTAGTMSDRTLIRLLLQALTVENADALLDEILPEGADYFDTDNDPVEEPNPFLQPGGEVQPPPFLREAERPPQPAPRQRKQSRARVGEEQPEDEEGNPNVDDRGVGTDESGLHKVAPPPPSMRNQKGKSANPFDATTPPPDFGEQDKEPGQNDDKDSQRMRGTTPQRTRGR